MTLNRTQTIVDLVTINLNYDLNALATSELSLSATLISLGFSLDSLDKTNPQKTIFRFNPSKELHLAVTNFWQRKLLVEPLAFFEAQRYLKSRIYGE